MGDWLKVNGESIYGTTASIFPKLDWGRCTVRGTRLYLHVFNWPVNGKLVVPGLKNEVRKAYLLADTNRKGLNVSFNDARKGIGSDRYGCSPENQRHSGSNHCRRKLIIVTAHAVSKKRMIVLENLYKVKGDFNA
jgi:hypothetical protein